MIGKKVSGRKSQVSSRRSQVVGLKLQVCGASEVPQPEGWGLWVRPAPPIR